MNIKDRKTLFLLILTIFFGAMFILRFTSPEDEWLCDNGKWVKHGNPSAPQPNKPCGKTQDNSPLAVETVSSFYNSVSSYPGNYFKDGSYKGNTTLSEKFRATLDDLAQNYQEGENDPILCTSEKPISFAVGNPEVNGKNAIVKVEQTFPTGKRLLPVSLENQSGEWKIEDIQCSNIEPQKGLGN